MIGNILWWIIEAYVIVLVATALLSWFPSDPGTVTYSIKHALASITEPVVGPVRRAIPPINAGGMGIDIAFLIVLIGLEILASLVRG